MDHLRPTLLSLGKKENSCSPWKINTETFIAADTVIARQKNYSLLFSSEFYSGRNHFKGSSDGGSGAVLHIIAQHKKKITLKNQFHGYFRSEIWNIYCLHEFRIQKIDLVTIFCCCRCYGIVSLLQHF